MLDASRQVVWPTTTADVRGAARAHAAVPWWGWLMAMSAVAAGAVAPAVTGLHPDVAWRLYAARRWLDGARLYVDLVDVDPPMAFYLSVPAEWLSRAVQIRESIALGGAIAVFAACSVSVALAWWRSERGRVDGIAVAAVMSWIAGVMVLSVRCFGEREHLALIAITPFCWSCARLAQPSGDASVSAGRATRLAIGALAAIAVALTPLLLGVVVMLLAYVALCRRSVAAVLHAETMAAAGVLAAYVLFVALVHPAYLTEVVPAIWASEAAYRLDSIWPLFDRDFGLLASSSLVIACAAGFVIRDRFVAAIVRVSALVSLAFAVLYVAQARGWFTHALPAEAFNAIAACTMVAAFVSESTARESRQARPRAGTFALRAAVVGACAVPALVLLIVDLDLERAKFVRRDEAEATKGIALVRAHAEGQPIFSLSTSVAPAFPLVNFAGTTWPYRFKSLWPLPRFYRGGGAAVAATDAAASYHAKYHPPAAQSPAERAFFDDVVRELVERPPAVLIVDRNAYKEGFGRMRFDYVEYFSQAPAFAELFGQYRLVEHIGPHAIYTRARAVAAAGSPGIERP